MKKRFFLKLLLFLWLAYAVPALFIQFGGMNFFNREYPMWMHKKKQMEQKSPVDRDILIFGDSRTLAGVLPKTLSPDALSLAIGGSSSIEAYYLLKHYLRLNKPPKQILFSMTPLHFLKESCFWNRNVMFKFLSVEDSLEVLNRSRKKKMKPCPFYCGKGRFGKAEIYWKYWSHKLNLPYLYRAEIVKARLFDRRESNLTRWNYLEETNGHSFFGRKKKASGMIQETKHKTFQTRKLLVQYAKDFLMLARRNGIQVIVVNVPVNDPSYKKLKPKFLDGYTAFLEKLQKQFPEMIVDSGYPHYPVNHFGDTSHLNERGAKRFSRYLKERYFMVGPPAPSVLKEQAKWKVVRKPEKKDLRLKKKTSSPKKEADTPDR